MKTENNEIENLKTNEPSAFLRKALQAIYESYVDDAGWKSAGGNLSTWDDLPESFKKVWFATIAEELLNELMDGDNDKRI